MDSIRIDTGIKRIAINDDPNRIIEFNPSDVVFAEKFYQLIKDFEIKQADYEKRAKALDEQKDVDANGIPVNLEEGIALLRDVCEFMREKIDYIFGKGTSQMVFGDALNLEMFDQFFTGITPFIQKARDVKIKKYNQELSGRVMK